MLDGPGSEAQVQKLGYRSSPGQEAQDAQQRAKPGKQEPCPQGNLSPLAYLWSCGLDPRAFPP